jgi:hypothetical protein
MEVVICDDGTQCWYQNNKLHRLDGPAIVRMDGTCDYYQHNRPHRWDGPAITESDRTQHWFIYGENITEELSRYFNRDLSRESLTKYELLIFKLKWG